MMSIKAHHPQECTLLQQSQLTGILQQVICKLFLFSVVRAPPGCDLVLTKRRDSSFFHGSYDVFWTGSDISCPLSVIKSNHDIFLIISEGHFLCTSFPQAITNFWPLNFTSCGWLKLSNCWLFLSRLEEHYTVWFSIRLGTVQLY